MALLVVNTAMPATTTMMYHLHNMHQTLLDNESPSISTYNHNSVGMEKLMGECDEWCKSTVSVRNDEKSAKVSSTESTS